MQVAPDTPSAWEDPLAIQDEPSQAADQDAM